MVDLTKGVDPAGKEKPQARLMDLVAGRSGPAYSDWLQARGQAFNEGVKIATLDPKPLCSSSRRVHGRWREGGLDDREQVSGEVSLEAPQDSSLGHPLGRAPRHIVAGRVMVSQPGHQDAE